MTVAVMLVCLPLLALALRARSSHALAWREAALAATALWGAYLTIVTECLSAARLLTTPWLFACWAALALGAGGVPVLARVARWLARGGARWRMLAARVGQAVLAAPGRARRGGRHPGADARDRASPLLPIRPIR